ncbi:MAG: 2-amino-4-hydroxy-6-hydroxymethyldihydropteridine diphosphokinase [Chloroflexi bacterium]|nr:MAG: 2-amino-4-hydroxy-6-hydroxymethyldihydropteridine diphosphokinase [Chloroflexota bacterium]
MSLDTTVSPMFPLNGNAPTSHTIYLALGSNLGDRRGNLAAALQQLIFTTISKLYRTI